MAVSKGAGARLVQSALLCYRRRGGEAMIPAEVGYGLIALAVLVLVVPPLALVAWYRIERGRR